MATNMWLILLLVAVFDCLNAENCNSAFLNISITDSANPSDQLNLFAVGVCTAGIDSLGSVISQKMECVGNNIYQYVYANANCSDIPFKTNQDISGYCGGTKCTEYAQVLTYLDDVSCSEADGWMILPLLMYHCYPHNFGPGKGQSFKFFCDDTSIDLTIFDSDDCSDKQYISYTMYQDKQCIDGEYAEIVSCGKDIFQPTSSPTAAPTMHPIGHSEDGPVTVTPQNMRGNSQRVSYYYVLIYSLIIVIVFVVGVGLIALCVYRNRKMKQVVDEDYVEPGTGVLSQGKQGNDNVNDDREIQYVLPSDAIKDETETNDTKLLSD